jgi:hypothetical protein
MDVWRPPASFRGRFEHTETWSYVWDWMRGNPQDRLEPAKDIERHVGHLNGPDQKKRLAAIYTLGAMGEPALAPLLSSLLAVAGLNRIEPPYRQNADGSFETTANPLERRWTEGGYIFQDEAYALGCLGAVAIDPVQELLGHDDPWIVINAAFALGQTASSAARAVPKLASLLASPDHRVVRAVLESIACIGSNTEAALPALRKLLGTTRDAWEQDIEMDYLVGDQIHLNATDVLLQSDLDTEDVEELLIELLEQPAPFFFVPATALEILVRRGSSKGRRHALQYLHGHCWDDTG